MTRTKTYAARMSKDEFIESMTGRCEGLSLQRAEVPGINTYFTKRKVDRERKVRDALVNREVKVVIVPEEYSHMEGNYGLYGV